MYLYMYTHSRLVGDTERLESLESLSMLQRDSKPLSLCCSVSCSQLQLLCVAERLETSLSLLQSLL